MKYIIAYDLGTGGIKSSLFDQDGGKVASAFKECQTFYPADDFREQRPQDWWDVLKDTTKELLAKTDVDKEDIIGAGCSGHSLGVIPIGADGELLCDMVPIWSDARANVEEEKFFKTCSYQDWYETTGSGFPAKLYGIFKIMWYKEHAPEVYDKAVSFIGTKDYLNYRLTGVLATDHSYASGSGVYDLVKCEYNQEFIKNSGVAPEKLPVILESSDIVGVIKKEVAEELGLSDKMQISAGGVDNACMAAGAGCVEDGMAYTSLGTSSWIAVVDEKPIVNIVSKPYVFAHLIKGKYASATAIFSAGNTYRWVRDVLCKDLIAKETETGIDVYELMNEEGMDSSIGANGIYMVPHLAGGSGLDKCADVRGCYTGLDLKHTRGDLVRATLEGICFALRVALDELKKETEVSDGMLIVGGGAKSPFWMQLFANIYGLDVTNSESGENAGSLGAMATAAIGTGLWEDYSKLKEINKPTKTFVKEVDVMEAYEKLYVIYKKISEFHSEIAELQKSRKVI